MPQTPEFARTVDDPVHKIGDPLVVIAGREKAGRVKANRTITEFRDWYEEVRRSYSEVTD